MDIDLHRCLTAGELLPLRYRDDEISVSLRAMNDENAEKRRYEGTADVYGQDGRRWWMSLRSWSGGGYSGSANVP